MVSSRIQYLLHILTSPSKLGEPNDTVVDCLDFFICILPVGHHDLVPSLGTPLRSLMTCPPLSPSSQAHPSTCFLNSHTTFHIHLSAARRYLHPVLMSLSPAVSSFVCTSHIACNGPMLGFGDAAIVMKPLIEAAVDRFLSMRSTRVIDAGRPAHKHLPSPFNCSIAMHPEEASYSEPAIYGGPPISL